MHTRPFANQSFTVIVAAKSITPLSALVNLNPFPPDPNSQLSTITTVAREIQLLGGDATAIAVDTTSYSSIQSLVFGAVQTYGRLDVVVYNSGAIWWGPVSTTPMKRFQLMQRVNVEGLYGIIQETLPHLRRTSGRIVVVCPPIYNRFFRGKTAYAIGKVGMSVLVQGLGMDFVREGRGMGIVGIWPAVVSISCLTDFSNAGDSNANSTGGGN